MRVRKGYREWQKNIDNGNSSGVNTVIPYTSTDEGTTGNRLFSVTADGIWDTTDYGIAPVLKVAFSDNTDDAGFGTFCHYVDDSNADIVFYADSRNGLYTYTPGTDTWAQSLQA